jgi:hypothetical protein
MDRGDELTAVLTRLHSPTPRTLSCFKGYFNYFKKKEGKNLGTVFLQGCTVTAKDDMLAIQSGA